MMRYRNKIEWIIPFAKGKKVLDLGCVQRNSEKTTSSEWQHGNIKKYARSLTGVDILGKEIEELNRQMQMLNQ